MLRDIFDTIEAFFSSFRLANKYGLFRYLWLSGLISLVLGLSIFGGVYTFSDDLGSWLVSFWKWDWGSNQISTISSYVGGIFLGLIGLLSYKYIVMVAVAPVMGPLSERLEEGLLGQTDGEIFSYARFIRELFRGTYIALRNLVRELFLTIILLIVSLFPGMVLFTTPVIYLLQSYYAGFGNMDYLLERHLNIGESVDFVRQHRWVAITNGALFLLLLLIPIVGLFLAPFLCTITGTKVGLSRLNNF